jgi:tetratricopeptide (TPR) repeat protein
MNPVTSLPSALASITLSVSLALGLTVPGRALASTVALAAPPAEAETPPTGDGSVETGASTAEKSEADSLSEQAIAEFSAKNYAGAIALFEQAYEIDPQPNFLFNIGRVHEEAGNLEQAVEYYAKFVKQPGVDLDSRGVALDRLKVLRAIVEETKEPDVVEPEVEPEPAEPVPAPTPVDTDSERKRKIMRVSGFALIGVGAGALIGGAVLGSLAQGDRDKAFDRDEADSLAGRRELLDTAQTKALTADVLYGVGGAVLLTGVILVAVGYAKPKTKTQRVALTPSFGPQGGGVELLLRF